MKWIAIILGALLIVTNSFWLYSAIDFAVTEKYDQQEVYEAKNKIKALTKLNNHFVNGMPKEELNETLKALFPDFEPYEKERKLNTLWLSFKVNDEGNIEQHVANQ